MNFIITKTSNIDRLILEYNLNPVKVDSHVALYELKTSEVCVIGYHGCGMNNINLFETIKKMQERGIYKQTFDTLEFAGINIGEWLSGLKM